MGIRYRIYEIMTPESCREAMIGTRLENTQKILSVSLWPKRIVILSNSFVQQAYRDAGGVTTFVGVPLR